MATPLWIDLDGTANARDLAGMRASEGRQLRPGRLIRSDNLQDLSEADVRRLVDELGVRDVVDLRTGVEVRAEGPGPLTREPAVRVRHLSLFPEAGETTDVTATDGAVVLPWQERAPEGRDDTRPGAVGVYLGYLRDRPDSVVEALRTIATSDGATIVHCAAGKDRTGVVIALALAEVGVEPDEIVADYARTAERIDGILTRLRASDTYREDIAAAGEDASRHTPRAETMAGFLAAVDEDFGGAGAWLRANGWTEDDADRLRRVLVE